MTVGSVLTRIQIVQKALRLFRENDRNWLKASNTDKFPATFGFWGLTEYLQTGDIEKIKIPTLSHLIREIEATEGINQVTPPPIWEEIRALPSFLFKDHPGHGYPTIKTDEALFRLRTMVDQTVQTYEGMVESRELVIAQHLKKFDDVGEWAFNMACRYEDCTYMSREAFDEDAKKALKELIKLAGPWVPPELRDTTETTEVEPEPDKWEGFKVFDYLGMSEIDFHCQRVVGTCAHPKCDRETSTGHSLCRWHRIAFIKWLKKRGGPTI